MQSRDHNDCRHQQDSQRKCTDQILIICHLLCKYNRFVPSLYPIRNAVMVVAQTDTPSTAILSKKSFVRIDSFNGLGFSSITALECGSSPSAIAGRLSVSRLIKSKCTGANGTGTYFVIMNKIAHTSQKVGLASAMSVVLLMIIFICTILQNVFFKYVFRDAASEDESYKAKKARLKAEKQVIKQIKKQEKMKKGAAK